MTQSVILLRVTGRSHSGVYLSVSKKYNSMGPLKGPSPQVSTYSTFTVHTYTSINATGGYIIYHALKTLQMCVIHGLFSQFITLETDGSNY